LIEGFSGASGFSKEISTGLDGLAALSASSWTNALKTALSFEKKSVLLYALAFLKSRIWAFRSETAVFRSFSAADSFRALVDGSPRAGGGFVGG
jgi:hypothetical protein